MNINFEKASFRDFENIPGMDVNRRSAYFAEYLNYLKAGSRLNYRLEATTGCGPEVELDLPAYGGRQQYVSLVSNDYLGLTQHPEVKNAAVQGIQLFGTGAGASPAIGGQYSYHELLERKIAGFFKRKDAIIYTTGYTANSASLLCLLKKEDLAILDMAVHASVYEGCSGTTVKSFLHNNLEALERILKDAKSKYRTKMVIVDGVYSQDGDLAPLDRIMKLCRNYGAYLLVDDAHGIGVVGKTGRGLLEHYDLLQEVDIITGTFSKTFAHVGGYVIANRDVIDLLKYQSRQHLFSATLTPACLSIVKALELIDTEPERMARLWDNINYFSSGLKSLGLNIGNTSSAIIPVKIGDPQLNAAAAEMLLQAGVYANPIMYPAVSRKDARIRMSLMATHTIAQLDKVLNAFEYIAKKLNLPKEDYEKSR